jgi:hypothetical protein
MRFGFLERKNNFNKYGTESNCKNGGGEAIQKTRQQNHEAVRHNLIPDNIPSQRTLQAAGS